MRWGFMAISSMATVVLAAMLSGGVAQAGVPSLTSSYDDSGCACFAMFPAQPKVEQIPGAGREGLTSTETSVLAPTTEGAALRLAYWRMPAGATYDLHQGISSVADFLTSDGMETSSIQYGTFRGHPSVTGEFRDKDQVPGYAKALIFTVDDRVFALRVATRSSWGASPSDGVAAFNAFVDAFQVF